MKLAVLSDFDGTVTLNDTFQNVVEKLGQGDWRAVDDQYVRGEITLDECLRRQGGMVRASKSQILKELDQVTKFRSGFDNLAEYCQTHHYPLVVVSAGLDFVIKHFLTRENLMDKVELFAATAKCMPTGIKFDFLKLKDKRSISFKDDIVRYYRTKAEAVAYIGDGRWDLQALRNADLRFAIKNSKLAELCKEQEIQTTTVANFTEVVTSLQKKMSERNSWREESE
ncbi:MAG TPA: HAD-IB family phosphatase [Candidatus Bathyarchaeia archaeon]|nr:HAD-IB family phosphatase [Candidatus Bathyarchaeia archaeon]